jgi:urease subunit beta
MKPATHKTENAPALYPGQPGYAPAEAVAVGGVVLAPDAINYNCQCRTVRLKVRNTGDRPIQIGSHFHFFEVNRYMQFDRAASFGCHLNIPATTALRFEPGDEKEVELVPFGGKCRIIGFNGLTRGFAGDEDQPGYFPVRLRAMARVERYGFATV